MTIDRILFIRILFIFRSVSLYNLLASMSAVFSIYLKYDPSLATVNSWIGAANLMQKQKTKKTLLY